MSQTLHKLQSLYECAGLGVFPDSAEKKGIKKKELNQMKYPKVLQMLALATAITVAAPSVTMPAYASETAETPQEYTERTGWRIYHTG